MVASIGVAVVLVDAIGGGDWDDPAIPLGMSRMTLLGVAAGMETLSALLHIYADDLKHQGVNRFNLVSRQARPVSLDVSPGRVAIRVRF